MPKKTARRIIDTRQTTGTTILTGVTVSGSPGSGASAAMAGDGLTYSSGVLNVGAGTGITVAADSVSLASTVAGNGLTHSSGVLNVGAGTGITVNADDVALSTPGTLTASTSNSASGNHTHAVTTGAASTLTVSTSNATGSSASLARADHLHTITTSSDVTASGTSILASSAGNLKLATGNIGSTLGYNGTFTSGFAGAGWQVDYGVTEAAKTSATFDNLTIRGRMRVYELLIQQIRATNGSVLVSSSSKVMTTSIDDDPLWTVNGLQLTFNGVNATLETTLYTITTSDSTEATASRTHYHGFLVGDIIRAQQVQWNGSSFGGVFQSDLQVTGVTDLYTYRGARVSTTSDAPVIGYDYVRIGSASDTTRQGVVYLTSDDSNAPFIDIVDGVAAHSDWNTAGKIQARLGKLSGITDAQWGTLSGYGLWSNNVYLTGNIYATDGIFNGTVYASAGTFTGAITAQSGSIDGFLTIGTSGGIYQGTGTAGAPTTGLKIWNDSGVGRIGGYNSGNLQWYASTTGYFYSGSGTMRIGSDDIRLQLGTYDGDYSDYRTIKWIPSIDGTDTNRTSFDYRADITAYASTSPDISVLNLASRVNVGDYDTRDAQVIISATNYNGSTIHSASIYIVQEDSGTTYANYIGLNSQVLYLTRTTGRSDSPSSGYCYLWVDSSTNTLKMKDSGGTTRSVTFT